MSDHEVQLLINRINRLEHEEERARKRISDARKKTQQMVEAKKRNEEHKREKDMLKQKLKEEEEKRREKFLKDRTKRKSNINQNKSMRYFIFESLLVYLHSISFIKKYKILFDILVKLSKTHCFIRYKVCKCFLKMIIRLIYANILNRSP